MARKLKKDIDDGVKERMKQKRADHVAAARAADHVSAEEADAIEKQIETCPMFAKAHEDGLRNEVTNELLLARIDELTERLEALER